MTSEDYQQTIGRIFRAHEKRYVCSKRARKLRQRGEQVFKDGIKHYWFAAK